MRPPASRAGLTLCALTLAAALAPAHAMAVANNPSAGECRAPGAGDTVVLIGGQLCAANQGSGGNAGTGTGALPGGRQPGETIWVTGEIPECLRNSARCLPGQIGGRGGRQSFDGEGPGSGGPSGGKGSAGSGKKAETKKGERRRAPTRKECEAMQKGGFAQPFADELSRLQERVKDLEGGDRGYLRVMDETRAQIDFERRRLPELPFYDPKGTLGSYMEAVREFQTPPAYGHKSKAESYSSIMWSIRLLESYLRKVEEQRQRWLLPKLEAERAEKDRIEKRAVEARNALLLECGELHK